MSEEEIIESLYANTNVPSLSVAHEVVAHLLDLGILEVNYVNTY